MELNSAAGNLSMDQEYYLTREDIEDFKQNMAGCGVTADGFYILKVDENNTVSMKQEDISNEYELKATVESITEPMQPNIVQNNKPCNVNIKRRDTYDDRFPFRCKLCSACFTQKKSLASHSIYSHKNNKPVNSNVIFCHLCTYLTIDQKFMDKHMLTHEDKKDTLNNGRGNKNSLQDEPQPRYFCNKCSFNCKIEDTFIKHKKLHDSLEQYQLSKEKALESNTSHQTTNTLVTEVVAHANYKPQPLLTNQEYIQQCETAPVSDTQPSNSNQEVAENIEIISDIQLDSFEPTHFFKCKECFFTSNYLTQLKNHQKEQHYKYKCFRCDVIFESNAHLKQHQQIHIHNFDCNLCGKEFALLKDLKAHHKVHANRNKYFYCSICGFMSFGEKEIRNHFPCLSENVCQKCKMKFKHPLSLKKHIEENHGTFQCDYCGHTIVDKKKDFINHIKLHEEEKNESVIKETFQYQCFECNRGFKVRSRLSEHLKTHGIFTCHICDSSFFSIRDLKLHGFTHEEKITSYLCEQCGLECATKYDLSNHVLTHNISQTNYQV